MCINYWGLNKMTIKNVYPLDDIPETVFCIHNGYYEFLAMSFALTKLCPHFNKQWMMFSKIISLILSSFSWIIFYFVIVHCKAMFNVFDLFYTSCVTAHSMQNIPNFQRSIVYQGHLIAKNDQQHCCGSSH